MACFHHTCFRTGVWRCLELDVVTLETRHSFSAQESGCETTSAEKRGKYVEENWLLGVRDLSRIFEFGRNVGNSASDCKWYRVVIYY